MVVLQVGKLSYLNNHETNPGGAPLKTGITVYRIKLPDGTIDPVFAPRMAMVNAVILADFFGTEEVNKNKYVNDFIAEQKLVLVGAIAQRHRAQSGIKDNFDWSWESSGGYRHFYFHDPRLNETSPPFFPKPEQETIWQQIKWQEVNRHIQPDNS